MPLSPRDRRALIVFGTVTVVAAAAFFLFIAKGPKKAVTGSSGVPRVVVTQPTPSPSPSKAKKQHKEVFVFSGRDPFDPAQGGGQAAVPAGAPAASPVSNPAPNPSSQNVGGKTVVLVDIFTENNVQKAQVEVDGTVYTVAPGDTFDDNYRLVSISGSCADFTHGQTSFTLCETQNK